MKFNIYFGLLFFFTACFKSYAQFEINDMMYQMQMQMYQQNIQKAFGKIECNHSYKSFDGQSVSCIITMARMTGFSEVSASIQNRDRTESQKLSVECYNPMSITISAGGSDWNLAYGDRITIIYDGDKSKMHTVGIDENMSGDDWERYTRMLKNAANFTPPTQNLYSGRSIAEIQLDIKRTHELLNSCERNKATSASSSPVISSMYDSQIISLRRRLNELNQELIRAGQ